MCAPEHCPPATLDTFPGSLSSLLAWGGQRTKLPGLCLEPVPERPRCTPSPHPSCPARSGCSPLLHVACLLLACFSEPLLVAHPRRSEHELRFSSSEHVAEGRGCGEQGWRSGSIGSGEAGCWTWGDRGGSSSGLSSPQALSWAKQELGWPEEQLFAISARPDCVSQSEARCGACCLRMSLPCFSDAVACSPCSVFPRRSAAQK